MIPLPQLFQSSKPVISIEIFPPKTPRGDELLIETLDTLREHQPAFISCTYGAGGSTRTRTIDLCQQIQERYDIPTTAHFTCVGSSKEELVDWLTAASKAGIQNIMALRGDAPKGEETFKPAEGGLTYANELVSLIREHHPEMGIGVAAYPEKHPECLSADLDLENLKRKIDAGADAAFTQLFFDNSRFFGFRERYDASGCKIPLVPGIMPITEFARIRRISAMCGSDFPAGLAHKLEAVQDDAEAQLEIGVQHAVEQCQELLDQGVPGIHFYALNKSQACQRILSELKL
ncbi:methylenetetrahydrofolate reductase [NAD(P)H] [Rubinisphaera margarita]|uniref:methylenetetrahydrofolate reductase [NAD(P)H] n=1 Tax=Rubinisphaera margarita TaxID=2909586 RepID=UPI001EE8AF0C|nr:methylenetetrahydrofolate reductase [NAD(P)H] [Rubinisphaera margarita]MCG6157365.1 methylenetetrahydrofolate reductase [NAD(P)H] [Rubinisphaera margarita]